MNMKNAHRIINKKIEMAVCAILAIEIVVVFPYLNKIKGEPLVKVLILFPAIILSAAFYEYSILRHLKTLSELKVMSKNSKKSLKRLRVNKIVLMIASLAIMVLGVMISVLNSKDGEILVELLFAIYSLYLFLLGVMLDFSKAVGDKYFLSGGKIYNLSEISDFSVDKISTLFGEKIYRVSWKKDGKIRRTSFGEEEYKYIADRII